MIYLVRHGQTVANKEELYVGISESELTEEGRWQHSAAASKLQDIEINKVISSPRKRCMLLANEICKGRDIKINIDDRIAEIDFGIFEGLSHIDIQKKHPKLWKSWLESNGKFAIPDGERVDDFDARVMEFADEVIELGEDDNVVVVTHGGIIMSLICNLLNQSIDDKWRYKVENGAVVKVQVSDKFAYIVLE